MKVGLHFLAPKSRFKIKSIIPLIVFLFNHQVLLISSKSAQKVKVNRDIPLVFDYKNPLGQRDMAEGGRAYLCIYCQMKTQVILGV